jgi:hypothetical protein
MLRRSGVRRFAVFAPALLNLARSYEKAVEVYAKGVKQDASHVNLRVNLGNALRFQGQLEQGERCGVRREWPVVAGGDWRRGGLTDFGALCGA